MNDLFVRVTVALKGFRAAISEVGDSVREFGRAYNGAVAKMAEPFYASAHGGRLPGSERTARLRKKRRDAVLRWWREQQ